MKNKIQNTRNSNLKQIFGKVDNLGFFTHPKYNQKFKFMSTAQVVDLAKDVVEVLVSNKCHQVVVSETGARPLAYVCEQILKKRKEKINWLYVKFPREPVNNIYYLLLYYLNNDERKSFLKKEQLSRFNKYYKKIIGHKKLVNWGTLSRQDALQEICKLIPIKVNKFSDPILAKVLSLDNSKRTIFHKLCNIIFEDTKVANILSTPFVYLDEYITSGTTLQNANHYFSYFTSKSNFKIITYCINILQKDLKKYSTILYSKYYKNTVLKAYKNGVYPFENRVDLMGCYYFINKYKFIKNELNNILPQFNTVKDNTINDYIKDLHKVINDLDLVNVVKKNCKIKQVKDYLDENHIIRYLLYFLEKRLNKNKEYYEFFWQLFDMYGPIFFPLPISYHFDFWEAFEGLDKYLQNNDIEHLINKYKKNRSFIIKNVTQSCLLRRKKWKNEINKLI